MRKVFVDTHFFIALMSARDQWHSKAVRIRQDLTGVRFVTADSILIEVLNFVCDFGPTFRARAVEFVRQILVDADFEVASHSYLTFLIGLELYESRLDKGYSLTDCISMNLCREHGISEVLTSDRHFEQEGFICLL